MKVKWVQRSFHCVSLSKTEHANVIALLLPFHRTNLKDLHTHTENKCGRYGFACFRHILSIFYVNLNVN